MGKLEKRMVWGLVFGAMVYAGIALVADARALGRDLVQFRIGVMAAALGLSVVNYGLRFIKWHAYLRRLGVAIGIGESLNVFLAGMVMSVTPGKFGEVLKSMLLKERHGLAVARTAPVVVAERLTDLLGLIVIAAVGLTTFNYGQSAFVAVVVAVFSSIAVLHRPKLVEKLLDGLERLPVVGELRPRLEEAYGSMAKLLDWKLIGWTTLVSLVGWSMEAFAFYLILEALGAEAATFQLAAFVFAMTTILGAVSLLPGGLGVTEGSMIGVLVLLGVFASESTAGAATYLIRFATLWFGVLVGLAALLWYRMDGSRP